MVMSVYSGSAAAEATVDGACVSPVPQMSVMVLVFCADTSVSMAAAWAGFAAFTAVMKLNRLVNAGVVRWGVMSTFHSGVKPSATASLGSTLLSYRSHNTAHTEDSLHQQPSESLSVGGLSSTSKVLRTRSSAATSSRR